jgi:hypothetical protein
MHDNSFGLSNTLRSGFVQMYKPINGDMQGKFVKVEMYEYVNGSGNGTMSWRNLHVMTTRQANEYQSLGLSAAVEAPIGADFGD